MLTQSINWHWIFFVNIPIGIATGVLALRLLRDEAASASARAPTSPARCLVTSALMLGVYTIVKVPEHGWGAASTLGFGAASLALLAAFVVREAPGAPTR